jgi:hypothetical protein
LIDGHFYRCRDLEAGVRRYRGTNRAWTGGYLQACVDTFTGAPVAVELFPADVQEFNGYPALFSKAETALGERPYIVAVDRHYSFRGFYEWNIRRGVAVVAKRRTRSNRKEHIEWRCDAFDEDGVPRCRHCGGEGDQDGPGLGLITLRSGDPAIRFRCLVQFTEACKGVQQIRCSEEWVLLGPLSRKTELYYAVRRVPRNNKENVFNVWRLRYRGAGKDTSSRLFRPGIGPQRLRAWSAVLLDWFRVSLRNGYLDPIELPVKMNTCEPEPLSGIQDRSSGVMIEPGVGSEWLGRRLQRRYEERLHLPYGQAWETLQARLRSELADSGAPGR